MISLRRFAALCSYVLVASTANAAEDPVAIGQKIAINGVGAAAACATCHGAKGEGNPAAGFPRLAGLGSVYLKHQLDDMADGGRPSPIMAATAQALSPADREAVALYYASLPAPYDVSKVAATGQSEPMPSDRGAWLAIRGGWEKNLPACNQCHGPGGIGVGEQFPALAGQSKNYLIAQLQAWQAGKRSPLPLGLMPSVATKLTAQDIDAVATYYSELPKMAQEKQGAKP